VNTRKGAGFTGPGSVFRVCRIPCAFRGLKVSVFCLDRRRSCLERSPSFALRKAFSRSGADPGRLLTSCPEGGGSFVHRFMLVVQSSVRTREVSRAASFGRNGLCDRPQRHHQRRAACGNAVHERLVNGCPPATSVCHSFSRSRASIHPPRSLSIPLPCCPQHRIGGAHRGETLRLAIALVSLDPSSKTSASVSRSPFSSWCAFQRRSRAHFSCEATRKIFQAALGKNTVPMSRPSTLTPPPSPPRCLLHASTLRLLAIGFGRPGRTWPTSGYESPRVKRPQPSIKTQFLRALPLPVSGLAVSARCWSSFASARGGIIFQRTCMPQRLQRPRRLHRPRRDTNTRSIAANARATLEFAFSLA